MGLGESSKPGFSSNVPSRKREFFGLIQNSSTLILLEVLTPWRDRKLCTFAGASSFRVKNESQNSSWKSRWISKSAPRGSTNTLPVLSSKKKGTCMHSAATLTHSLLLPLRFHSHATVR